MEKGRAVVFIDGSNFYFKLKSLQLSNLLQFQYRHFIEWLAKNHTVISANYYIGVVRAKQNDQKSSRMRYQQKQLFRYLTDSQKIIVKKGYLLQTGNSFHEKGVDVQIAVDLLVGAYENKYDIAMIISSDTDLLPAIKKVKQLGKKVVYVGFVHHPSIAMQRHATYSQLLKKEDLFPFSYSATRCDNNDRTFL